MIDKKDTIKENEEFPPYLPKKWAYGIIFLILTFTLGIQIPFFWSQLSTLCQSFPWSSGWLGIAGKVILFVVTSFLALRQLDYYYGYFGSGKSGFFKSLRWWTPREITLDMALGVWGALLWFFAINMPAFWLAAFGIYCFFGWSRCHTTLRRKIYSDKAARKLTRRPLWGNPLSSYPIGNLKKFSQSIDGKYGPFKLRFVHVLTGWCWAFSTVGFISIMGFITSFHVLLHWGNQVFTVYCFAWALVQMSCWGQITAPLSLKWGKKTWQRYVKSGQKRRLWTVYVKSGVLIGILMLGGMLSRHEIIALFVRSKAVKQEVELGVIPHFKSLPPGYMRGIVVSYMTPIWQKEFPEIIGNNYWTIGAQNQRGYSTRFDPKSEYYQSWLGVYVAKVPGHRPFGLRDDGIPDITVLTKLAILDQKAWLHLYGDPNPKAEVKKIVWQYVTTIDGHKAFVYYGEIESHADVSRVIVKYRSLFTRAFRTPQGKAAEIQSSTFVPIVDLWDDIVKPHHTILLKGYYVAIAVPEKDAVVCLYLNGAEYQTKSGVKRNTFPHVKLLFDSVIRNLYLGDPR